MSIWDVEATSGIQGDLEELREKERERERERVKDACMMTYTKNTILVIDWSYATSRAHKNGRPE